MKEHACQVNLGYHIIVIDGSEKDILKTAKSIQNQYIDPFKVTFIKTVDNPADLFKKINKYIDGFTIVKTLYEDYKNNTIDVIIKKTQANYYLVINGGTELSDELLYNINYKICSGDNIKCVITDNISMYSVNIHNYLCGNVFKKLDEKIEECFSNVKRDSFDM